MTAWLLPAACGGVITGGLFLITWAYAAANPSAIAFAVLASTTLVAGTMTGKFITDVIRHRRENDEAGNDSPAEKIESLDAAYRLFLDWLNEPRFARQPVADESERDPSGIERSEPRF